MKTIFCFILFCIILGSIGCKRIRYNDNINYPTELVEKNYPRDEQYCVAISKGLTPDPKMMQVPQSYSVNTQGGLNTPFGYSSYSQRTNIDNSQASTYAGAYNFGAGIATRKQYARNYNMCMETLGWMLRDNATPEMSDRKKQLNRRYELYKKLTADPMYEQVVTYMLEQAKKRPKEEELVIANAWKENPEIFERDYDIARPIVERMLQSSTITK